MNNNHRHLFSNNIYKKRIKVYATITTIILFALIFLFTDSLQFENKNALAQSELIAKTSADNNNAPSTDNFNLTSGYTIEPVVWNLTAPDSITFDNKGNMYIGEAGYPLTLLPKVPKILKVTPNGNISVFVDKGLNSPIVDVVYYNETTLYVSHNHKISIVNLTNGAVKDVIVGLPTNGDHQNNQIAFNPDGKRLYVGIGSATNSGVVGEDNAMIGWLPNEPNVHDVPAKNITLTGQNFITKNPLTAEPNDTATTGAFVPFGTSTYPGQVIPGNIKCNGCILSANRDGTDLKLVGWGFRNPTGLAFNEEGRLFAVNHGADQRGSRPIANDSDKFHELKLNDTAFYGWPDFFGNADPATDPKFQSPRGGGKPLQFLMQNHPSVEKPFALFEPPHTSGIQIAFANESFGFPGEAFVAQMGTDAPISRPLPPPETIIGQNVVRVNIDNKTISNFLNLNKATTSFRPTDIVFSQNGSALYIVDWGNLSFTENPPTTPNSGVVWKITPSSARNQ
jgi:glucose/arabinose dehydrogenase